MEMDLEVENERDPRSAEGDGDGGVMLGSDMSTSNGSREEEQEGEEETVLLDSRSESEVDDADRERHASGLTSAWPDTLVAASIRGIVRTLASICFSSSVGRWVDSTPDRLKTLLTTVTVNRVAVICASGLWFFIVGPSGAGEEGHGFGKSNGAFNEVVKVGLFVLILGLGVLEGLSASGNMLSMERDWVMTAAGPEGHEYDLTHLNATMRRIDLSCKLLAPILISVITSAVGIKVGVVVVGGMSAVSWGIEMWCAKRVWAGNANLQKRKVVGDGDVSTESTEVRGCVKKVGEALRLFKGDFRRYFSTKVWVPSLSLSLLHLSALSYGATFITFLLNAGFSLDSITFARAAGCVVEISSTVVTPIGVEYLSKAHGHGLYDGLPTRDDLGEGLLESDGEEANESGKTTTGLERLGLWGLTWQLINLIPVTLILWILSTPSSTPLPATVVRILPARPTARFSLLLPLLLFTNLSFSRLGLWIFDLTTQQLTQTLVPSATRSSFTGCEYSLVAFFELGNFVMAMIWHRPEQFRWIALISLAAVGVSSVMYAEWVRRMRGHLVHWEKLAASCKCGRG
ncbi:iron transporter protein [Rutstroemia sp. NJR-2017a BBW]|nr:iron transporter protein [Rutstroemia sp. NJR-2017a BBW]